MDFGAKLGAGISDAVTKGVKKYANEVALRHRKSPALYEGIADRHVPRHFSPDGMSKAHFATC